MPRVDFYILGTEQTKERFCCELAGKIRKQDRGIYIHAASREEAQSLDDMLWTYRDISFLPHAMAGEQSERDSIIIGWEDPVASGDSVMINLGKNIPAQAEAYERVVEIVEDSNRQEGRNRYKLYRDAGFDMHNHDMSKEHG